MLSLFFFFLSNDKQHSPKFQAEKCEWACLVLSQELTAQFMCCVNNEPFGRLRFCIWRARPQRDTLEAQTPRSHFSNKSPWVFLQFHAASDTEFLEKKWENLLLLSLKLLLFLINLINHEGLILNSQVQH